MEDSIGWEVDVFADFPLSAETTISLGLGIFLPNKGAPIQGTLPAAPSGNAGNNEDEAAFLFYLQALTTL
ncbi:MAG: hypothetical protein ACI97A_001154 [Planctomycetota bacterium]|jgi:hypothetical protein